MSYADTADALAVPRPFEVGASLSGNYLAAIVAGAERDTLAASTFFVKLYAKTLKIMI